MILRNIVGLYLIDGQNYFAVELVHSEDFKRKIKITPHQWWRTGFKCPNFEIWDNENSWIMTWTWHSMVPEIS